MKKLDQLEQRLAKSLDTNQANPAMKKLSDDMNSIKALMEKQAPPDELLSKINEMTQKQKTPLEASLKDIHSKIDPIHQASKDVFSSSFLSST